MKQTLIIFTKNLSWGKVKTRLAATAGNQVAFYVFEQLLQHTSSVTKNLPLRKIVFYSDKLMPNDIWSDSVFEKRVQRGKDLGDRIKNAFTDIFRESEERIAIIGSDCPQITSTIIMKAFSNLNEHDIIIGPAKDGGYYLMAMKKNHLTIFDSINWSTDGVLVQTLDKCKSLNLNVHLLEELTDIDTEEDLKNFRMEFPIDKV